MPAAIRLYDATAYDNRIAVSVLTTSHHLDLLSERRDEVRHANLANRVVASEELFARKEHLDACQRKCGWVTS